jgi:oligopeptidase B
LAAINIQEKRTPKMTNQPVAPKRPTRIEQHGDVRIDDYFWLRDRTDPATLAYLAAENDYTDELMGHTATLQEELYSEMRARIAERDQSAPEALGGFFYYQRFEPGQQYPIFCRRQASMDAAEQVLLDVNTLAGAEGYAEIGNFRLSPDHHLLAYSLDSDGSETYTLFVKDLNTDQLLADQISNTYYGLEWANDNQTLYYTVLDTAKRPFQVYRHQLGADPATAELLFAEADPRYELRLRKSKSGRFLIIQAKSNTTTEEWLIPADDPHALPALVEPRQSGVEYTVTHHGDRFYIVTNLAAHNFQVMIAPVNTPSRAHWQPFLTHRTAVLVQAVDAFARHLVVYEREAGLRHLRIIDLVSGEDGRVALPEPIYALARHENLDFHSRYLRFQYESLVTPKSIYDVDLADRTLHLRKQETIYGYDATRYTMERLWATAPDGVQVPISLVRRKATALDGRNPLLLRGYGAYGASWDAYFDANRISLLERGFVFALAHIRGGSDLGRSWYEEGKLLHKKNTFTDFIACAETLIAQGYTAPDRLVIEGRSAGGLLMGAVTNLRPDLFAAVIAGVPFVDVINTMLDASIPLTAQEYEEWGDPADPTQYAYMRSYSPYDNVSDQPYPHLLATAGFNDPRVQYWEPAKWVAKLRTLSHNPNRVLLRTNMGAGHSGAAGRYAALRERAFEYAFLIEAVARPPVRR